MPLNVYIPDNNKIIHETEVDFEIRFISKVINLVQYDSGIPIVSVKLYSNGKKINLLETENLMVRLRWSIKTNEYVYKDILGVNETGDTAYFSIDSYMTKRPGTYNPILELVELDEEENIAGSSPMIFIIDRNPIQREWKE